MPVLYNNTIAGLLGILSSYQQCDCFCCHCTCLCHRRKGTTKGYTIKKDHSGGHSPSLSKAEESQRAPAGESHREEDAEENSAVQTTSLQAIDSECNSTIFDKSHKLSGGGESKSEEENSKEKESNHPSGDSKPSEHAHFNKVEEEGVASGIRQLTLEDKVLVNTTPPKQQTEPMASNLAGPFEWTGTGTDSITLKAAHPDPFYGGNLKAKIFLQQVDNKIANATGASEGQQIRYMISLLRGSAAEWAATYIDKERYTTFKRYGDLRRKFLERFTDPNLSGTALAQLLRLKQGRTGIQEYATKALTLAH